MPPIRQLDEAFLFRLLDRDENIKDAILNTNVDSESLSTVLKTLTETSNALQQELFQEVHTNFDHFSTSYNASQDLHSRIFELVKQVNSTEKQISDTQVHVSSTIDEYQHALMESQKNQVKIDTLQKLEQILEVIEMIHSELKESLYLEAVKHILELTRILGEWKEGDERVIGLVHDRIAHLKQTLILHLQDDIRTAIQYNMGSMRILETFKPNPTSKTTVHIQDVFQCLSELELLPEEMMGIQRLIFKNILHPYFENVYNHLQVDHIQVDALGSGGVLQVINNSNNNSMDDDQVKKMDPVLMLQQIDTILAFFFKYMFNSNKEKQMNHLFGNLLLPDLEEMMILKGIAPAIPSSKYNLSDFDKVAQAVTVFENQCMTTYRFQVDDAGATSLGLHVQNIDKHYAKKRRERILQEGRKVMIRRLYDAEMTQVEEDGHTYHYQITQTPQILSVLISDTLTEAANLLKSHPISASTLVEGIQDLLDMYRAIMPSYHRPQYLSGPAKSLVFRNDCLWLANQLKSSIAVKPESSKFEKLDSTLSEASSRLQELGKAWHELAMMHRVQMIQTILDGLDGFTGMAENAKFQQDCDHAISQVIELVGSFSSETRSVVDETLFLDMLGRIVDSILGRLIHDIEELLDIGAEESHVIARTLNSLAQLVGAFDLPGRDATETFVSELVPSWQKFWLVKDILEMNMRDIMAAFRHGDLHMFEKSELVGLLCALFADTELRESNIQEIKTGRSQQTVVDRSVSSPISFTQQQPSRTVTKTFTPAPTATATTAATTATTATSTIYALDYTPDDDMEAAESGWGDDDDDLFGDESLIPTDNHTAASAPISLEPSPLLDLDMDMDMDDTAGGWGDADEDIFDDDLALEEEKSNIPETTNEKHSTLPITAADTTNQEESTLSTTPATVTAKTEVQSEPPVVSPSNDSTISPTKISPATNSSTANTNNAATATHALTAPSLDFQDLENELDNEDGGWGWDDDEDLFKGEQQQEELK